MIIDYIRVKDSDSLSFLTEKLVILLLLLSGERIQTIRSLTIKDIVLSEETCVFYISALLKTSKPGRHKCCIEFRAFHEETICIVRALKKYLDATSNLRNDPDGQLLISVVKPHKPVSKDTIPRWVKSIMSKAGVDVKTFKPHLFHHSPQMASRLTLY
jgi:integrase